MKMDEVVGVCWFVVPMCCGFGVWAVCGPAVQSDFGKNRWPSASGYLGLDGGEVRFVSRAKYGMGNTICLPSSTLDSVSFLEYLDIHPP